MLISTLHDVAWDGVQDLDFRSRAIASIVDDWRNYSKLRWNLSDIADQCRDALKAALAATRQVTSTAHEISKKDKSELALGDLSALIKAVTGSLAALRRLEEATMKMAAVVDMLQDLKVDVGEAAEIHQYNSELAEMIVSCESILDNLEWSEFEMTAIPSDRLDSIAEYLRSTGQASV